MQGEVPIVGAIDAMSDLPRSRKRAVRLTPEGLGALQRALAQRWQSEGCADKLTREARADILGVSVATAGRVLSGSGVDRATLELAYRWLELSWDESFCEPLPTELQTTPVESVLAIEPLRMENPPSIRRIESAKPRRPLPVFLMGLAVVAIAGVAASLGEGALERPWRLAFNEAFDEGLARFHRSDYAGARAPLEKALALTREHDSIGKLASALRLAGDLAGAEGRLSQSKGFYEEALLLRNHLGQEVAKPAIYEALGDVETRLGDFVGAKGSLMHSLEGYRGFSDSTGVSMASRDLGTLSYRTGDLDSADHWFKRSLDALGKQSKPDIECDVRGQQALVLVERGHVAEACGTLRECLAYWTGKRHVRWIAVCELRLGLAEARRGDLTRASTLVSQSELDFRRVGDRAGALDAAGHLRGIAVEMGRSST